MSDNKRDLLIYSLSAACHRDHPALNWLTARQLRLEVPQSLGDGRHTWGADKGSCRGGCRRRWGQSPFQLVNPHAEGADLRSQLRQLSAAREAFTELPNTIDFHAKRESPLLVKEERAADEDEQKATCCD